MRATCHAHDEIWHFTIFRKDILWWCFGGRVDEKSARGLPQRLLCTNVPHSPPNSFARRIVYLCLRMPTLQLLSGGGVDEKSARYSKVLFVYLCATIPRQIRWLSEWSNTYAQTEIIVFTITNLRIPTLLHTFSAQTKFSNYFDLIKQICRRKICCM